MTTEEKAPERIRLGPEAIEILRNRCGEAMMAPEKTYFCLTCLDEGLVWVRITKGRYPYFAAFRCTCDGRETGYFIPATNRTDDKSRTLGARTWDTKILRYTEKGINKDEVYSMTARLQYEEEERKFRDCREHGEVGT